MVTSGYRYIARTFQAHEIGFQSSQWKRLITLRHSNASIRTEYPVNLARARSLGYKAKQGYITVVTRVRRGTLNKIRPKMGRKNANLGVRKITSKKNLQWVAEERTSKKYPNMEVLNSYKVGADGIAHYYEVILVDRTHPVIKADPKINWITAKNNKSRVYRGLTSAGKKTRGLRRKGIGAEKIRPSLRANRNLRR
jgi:large subunit ribosomal protein L15e